jgi:hypothetical protein
MQIPDGVPSLTNEGPDRPVLGTIKPFFGILKFSYLLTEPSRCLLTKNRCVCANTSWCTIPNERRTRHTRLGLDDQTVQHYDAMLLAMAVGASAITLVGDQAETTTARVSAILALSAAVQ